MALRSVLEIPAPPGVRKLRAFIVASGLSVPGFCEAKSLQYAQVRKLVAGEMLRIDIDLAADLKRATGGEIDVEDFVLAPRMRAQRAEMIRALRAARGAKRAA